MAEGRSGQRSNPRKLARANEAKRHTEQMAARYGREIERSLAGVRRVEAPVRSEVEGCVPEVTVMAADAVAAIRALPLSQEEQDGILGGNAHKLLNFPNM